MSVLDHVTVQELQAEIREHWHRSGQLMKERTTLINQHLEAGLTLSEAEAQQAVAVNRQQYDHAMAMVDALTRLERVKREGVGA